MAINLFSGGNTINSLQAAGKNIVINGGFDIWQRGTSVSTTGAFTADRWNTFTDGATRTVSRQVTGDTTNLPFIQYAGRFQRASGNTSTGRLLMGQSIESSNSIPLAGRTITFSFYARRGANYSSTSNSFSFYCASGTGTDQNIFSGFTGAVDVINTTATLTTTWQRFTATGTVNATATQLGFYFGYTPTGTAGANDYFEITGVQLELGTTATTFSRAGGTIQGELAACQRYYYRQSAVESFSDFGLGFAISTTSARIEVSMPVTMRIAATSLEYSTLILYDGSGTNVAVTSAALGEVNLQRLRLTIGVASGLTQYRPYSLLANNSTSAYVGFSAEL
jgi:hypothetical protein